MLWNRIRYLLRRDGETADLREEMRLHMELRARRMEERGIPAPMARSAARRQFGNPAAIQDASAEQWGWQTWDRLVQDVRQAFRTLRKAPAFAAFAVLTLAIGLGMNSAIFSVVNGVMLRPLPYPEDRRLVSLWEENTQPNLQVFNSHGSPVGNRSPRRTTVSFANLVDYRKRAASFDGLAAYGRTLKNLTGNGTPERISGEFVTPEFFAVLGVEPQIGRVFLPEEDRPDAPAVVVVSHTFWQSKLGGAPAVLERNIQLDGRPYRIVGVLPVGFRSPMQLAVPAEPIEFYLPPALPAAVLESHGDHDVNVVGRLKPGATLAGAQAELNTISAQLARQFPGTNDGIRAVVVGLRDDLTGSMRQPLWILLGASGLIVLITCVNIANLLLVRAMARQHETSVRFALGASRFRVLRQFLAESMLIAAGGCAAGLLVGRAMLSLLLALAPANLPRLQEIAMDWRVFGAGALVATLTGLAFGLAPAWHASTGKAADALKTAARNTGGRPQALGRTVLTASEVALSLVLLTGAGLLLRSFVNVMGVDLGFQPGHVMAMNINLPPLRYPAPETRLRFFQALEKRVQALPGVESLAYANRMPLRGGWGGSVLPDFNPASSIDVDRQAVSAGYFRTLGIPLVRGRLFTDADITGHPAVVVVDQLFARSVFGAADPVGRRVRNGSDQPWATIVGVVANMRRGGKEQDFRPQIYLPATQTELYTRVSLADLAVRTSGKPAALLNAIRQEVLALDADQPVTNVRTLEEIIDASVAERRFETVLLLVFAGLAVGLATLGLFGVLSYAVSQRTEELGIRIALGASPAGILATVLGQAGMLVGAGIAAGLAGSLVFSRWVASLLFQVKPTDLWTYAAAVGLLLAISLAAALVPARRGARVDPIRALRYE
jgi:putative ABC transport system permease protein